jgi:cell division protein FtsL
MAVAAPSRARRTNAAARKVATPARVPPAGRRAAAPERRRDSPSRPTLRVVSDARVVAQRRRRSLRALLLLVGFVMAASLFALAAFHAMLASGQAELDQIEQDVAEAQGRYEQLRLDVAELEAPDRIVREAQERLGMVPPPNITYLTPSEAVAAEVGQAAADDSPPTSTEAGDRAAWGAIKPYLSGRP